MAGDEAGIGEAPGRAAKLRGRGCWLAACVRYDCEAALSGKLVDWIPSWVVERKGRIGRVDFDRPEPEFVDGPFQLGPHGVGAGGAHIGKANEAIGMAGDESRRLVVAGLAVGMEDVEDAAFVDPHRIHSAQHLGRVIDHVEGIPTAYVAVKVDNHAAPPRMRSRLPAVTAASASSSIAKWCR